MSTPLFNNFVLSKDTTQAIFYNRNNDGAIVVVRFVNRGSERTRIALAVTNTQSLPTNLGEYVEFGTNIESNAIYEITSLVVPAGFYLVAYSTKSNVSVLCSGFATGSVGVDITINTAAPTAITGAGLVYHYDPNHLFGLDTNNNLVLPDIEKRTTMTGAGFPVYESGTKSYAFNGSNQWWASADNTLIEADGLFADVGNTWSVEAWFKFPVTPLGTRTGNQSWAICSKGGGIGGAETFTLFVGSATDTTFSPTVPYICYIGSRGSKTQISTGSVNDNTWRQVVVTWDGTAGVVYLNGSSRGALTVGGAAFQDTSTWTIGSAGNGAAGFAFEGSIGPIRIYNRSLTAGEVTTNFNYDRTRFGI